VLRSALKEALRWNLILTNPADLADLPRQDRGRVGVFTIDEARTFIRAIAGHPYEALFALGMTADMRPSEYLALTWNDIDLGQGAVSISRTLEWQKGGWQFADTKRSRSRRVVKLQSWVVELLRARQREIATAPEMALCSAPNAWTNPRIAFCTAAIQAAA
jgi:integrase